jgi:colanic acid/amylovoran biosynthesis glycosyltransferase
MESQKNNIAMVSPSQNAYSETFIQAQKNRLKGTVYYYYDGNLPRYIEKHGALLSENILKNRIVRKLGLTSFSARENAFISSLKKNKIGVVLAQYGTTAHRIVEICKHLNLPLITHFHGYDASKTSVIKSCDNYKEVFNYSSYVVAVSIAMKNKLLQLGCPEYKLVYNVYGPADEFLKVLPIFTKPQFIAVGRFVDKKAPYYLILAFNKVVKQYPQAQLLMAGTGDLLASCKNLVRYFNLNNNVKFLGVIKQNEYINYLKESIAFVQHSITAENGDSEGTPVAILEASAAGLPVISTRHAGIPDIIEDGKSGFLVDEHDVAGMANKMVQILRDQDNAKRMGKIGKDNIQKNFTLERHIQILNDLIQKCIKPCN